MLHSVPRLRAALIAASLLAGAGGGIAYAQLAPSYDPAQLPAIKGRVAQYSLTPRGDVDGLILEDGTQVHMPPHLGTQLVFVVKPGDTVTVHGLRARQVPMVQAMQVTNDATGRSVTDSGPGAGPHKPGKHRGADGPGGPAQAGQPMAAQGRIKAQLHGPRGDLNGVLLEDGTQVRLPPPEAQRLAAQLQVGQPLFVRGDEMVSPLGRLMEAHEIGPSPAQATPIQAPPPHGPHGQGGRDRPPPPGSPGAPPPPAGSPDAPAPAGTPRP